MTTSSNSKTRVEYDENLGVTLTSSYATILTVDSRKVSDSIIILNNIGSNALTYKIFGTPKNGHTPDISDSSWINILDVSATPALYTHTKSVTLAAGERFYESFSNKWGWVIVQGASASGTDVDVYHRGTT